MLRRAEGRHVRWSKLFMENKARRCWFPLTLPSPVSPARAKAAAGDAPSLARSAQSLVH